MASTYSAKLRYELPTNGEQSGTWGTTVNTNVGTLIEESIAGYISVAVATAAQALTANNGATDQARMAIVNLTGIAGAATLFLPPNSKTYTFANNTNGVVTVRNATAVNGVVSAGGTAVTVPVGGKAWMYSDGTNCYSTAAAPGANTDITSITGLTTMLALTQGGTGANSAAAAPFALKGANADITQLTGLTTMLALTQGGTGANSSASAPFALKGANADITSLATTTTINSSVIGYREVPSNNQTTSYTFALTDAGKHVYGTNAGAQTITLPTNGSVAFPVGTAITLVNNGTTAITFTTTSTVVYKAGTSAAWASGGTLAIRGMCTFLKVATDTWFVSGSGLS
jgi:hypothetical protein